MAGIVLTTAVRTGPVTTTTAPTSTLFIAGVTEKGPEGSAKLITSVADYNAIYGGYTSAGYVHESIQMFFEEGGSRAYVSRVIPSDATSASCAVPGTSGTSITLIASGEGTWPQSGVLEVEVAQPTVGVNVRLRVFSNDILVYSTPICTTRAELLDEINNSTIASLYVTAVAGASNTLPAVVTSAARLVFTQGGNGTTVTDANVETALDAFIPTLGPGAVAAPGFYTQAVYEDLIDHAKANNRIALLGFDKDDTVNDVLSVTSTYEDREGAENAAWFYPWVKIPRGSLTISVPCEGFIAAKRAAVHNQLGSWHAYAGLKSEARFVNGVQTTISSTQADALDLVYINPIRVISGTVRIYGARSASTDTVNFRYINSREVLNDIIDKAQVGLEALVFSVIDGRRSLFGEVAAVLINVLDPISKAGGLFELYNTDGKRLDPGYTIQVNDAINPISQLATGVVKAKVGARVSSIGDTIEVEITKSNLTSSLG
jgi:hypothetical protein